MGYPTQAVADREETKRNGQESIITNASCPTEPPNARDRDPVATLLSTRGRTHGDFTDHAAATQSLKDLIQGFVCRGHEEPSWNSFTRCQRESLDMIAHKLGRILAGDPNFPDHWDDIAGYARLVAERCSK